MLPPKRCTRSTRTYLKAEKEGKTQMNNVVSVQTAPQSSSLEDTDHEDKNPATEDNPVSKSTVESTRRVRRSLTADQRKALEELARESLNPSIHERREMALKLGLELRVVSSWFQNKRRPLAKLNDSTSTNTLKKIQPRIEPSNILKDVMNSETPIFSAHPEDMIKFPSLLPASASDHHARSSSWDLPSTPSPLQKAYSPLCSSSGSELVESPILARKRLSLEWACENETRKAKRIRSILEMSPLVYHSKRIRQRTDNRPRQPVSATQQYDYLSTQVDISHVLKTLGLGANSLDECDLEAAIILVQMREHEFIHRKFSRKSI